MRSSIGPTRGEDADEGPDGPMPIMGLAVHRPVSAAGMTRTQPNRRSRSSPGGLAAEGPSVRPSVMQQQSEQPEGPDDLPIRARSHRLFFHVPTVLVATLVIAPCHLGAFLVSAISGYSCCSSNGSTTATTVANVLGFPAVQLAWLLKVEQSTGWLLMVFNSLIWGIAIGTCLSFLLGKPTDAAA